MVTKIVKIHTLYSVCEVRTSKWLIFLFRTDQEQVSVLLPPTGEIMSLFPLLLLDRSKLTLLRVNKLLFSLRN